MSSKKCSKKKRARANLLYSPSGCRNLEPRHSFPVLEAARVAAERTLRKLGARAVPTQNVPVVFEPNIAGDLLGDIFQAVSGESIFRKASFLVGQLGERVANEMVTVFDDGRLEKGLG